MGKMFLALLSLAIVLAYGCAQTVEVPGTDEPDGAADAGTLKTFTLSGRNFRFMMDGSENPELRVKEGDKVRVEFTSTEGLHDWVVDEFSAATARVRAGNSTSVEFVADKKGTFEYYCSVGRHRAEGMKGNLIVE